MVESGYSRTWRVSVIRWSPGIICTVVPTSQSQDGGVAGGGEDGSASFTKEQPHQSAVKMEQLYRAWWRFCPLCLSSSSWSSLTTPQSYLVPQLYHRTSSLKTSSLQYAIKNWTVTKLWGLTLHFFELPLFSSYVHLTVHCTQQHCYGCSQCLQRECNTRWQKKMWPSYSYHFGNLLNNKLTN